MAGFLIGQTVSDELRNSSRWLLNREVTDIKGQKNHIILMRVAPSMKVHANQADEVFYRVGDLSSAGQSCA